jgi:seryl-tRNA synthetase
VTDFAFYNAGTGESRGLKRAFVPVRRVLRRVLRPIFLRQAELMMHLAGRIDETNAKIEDLRRRHDLTSDQIQDTIAFGWDHVAMARRLAALEDRVESLQAKAEAGRDDDGQLALPFPDLDHDLTPPRAEAC